jgi:hypothetical protein
VSRPDLELTEDDGYEALRSHVVTKALDARDRYGPRVDAEAMLRLLADPEVVRFPTQVVFDAGPLQPGEFAWTMRLGETPSEGFALVLHPELEARPEDWPLCAAYHLVTINYLDIATSREAELYGAALFGLEVDDYYERLCTIADSLPNRVGSAGHMLPGDAPRPATRHRGLGDADQRAGDPVRRRRRAHATLRREDHRARALHRWAAR